MTKPRPVPQKIPNDEFYEFIQKCKDSCKDENLPTYKEQIQEKFSVTDIEMIFFEYQDGTGKQFSDMFEYRAPVGLGGFGFVVAALDKETGEEIAIKLLRIDTTPQIIIDLFRKEAETLRNLHENYILSQSRSTDSKNSSRIYTPPK